jgi:hypothetical protein
MRLDVLDCGVNICLGFGSIVVKFLSPTDNMHVTPLGDATNDIYYNKTIIPYRIPLTKAMKVLLEIYMLLADENSFGEDMNMLVGEWENISSFANTYVTI